ncbi:hypothetical protein PHMEG_00021304, partial [Phytophthora megakarya]
KFKVALERLKKVWFTYNMEGADRADNLRTFIPGRMWPWCVGPDASLPIETLLGPTLPFYTIENFMQHPYNTVYVQYNAHVPPFLPANSTVEALGPQIVRDSALEPEAIDTSWDRAFRGAGEDEEMKEGEVGEDDADSTATLDLNQDSAGDIPFDPQDAQLKLL